jgi:hypothetical protein
VSAQAAISCWRTDKHLPEPCTTGTRDRFLSKSPALQLYLQHNFLVKNVLANRREKKKNKHFEVTEEQSGVGLHPLVYKDRSSKSYRL